MKEIKKRINFLKNFLISNGIEEVRILIMETLEADQNENSLLRGSEYLVFYPENDHNEELGVIIKVSE